MNKPLLWLAGLSLAWPLGLAAQDRDALAEGGRLYDKWWVEYGLAKPTPTHPAYPAAGKQRGADTWRCKECHGWDYRGRDGAYAKGGHYTGIKGIREWSGASPDAVFSILKDTNHQYDRVMLDPALRLLAHFVTEGQLDTTRWIEGKQVRGDADQGARLFEKKCARCHGEDGRDLNFKTAEDPEYLGTVASENPWELLHKIRNGHPGSRMPMGPGMMGRWRMNESMPNFRDLSEAEQAAIAAHAQTLPPR